jgi:hypothetical protein
MEQDRRVRFVPFGHWLLKQYPTSMAQCSDRTIPQAQTTPIDGNGKSDGASDNLNPVS